MAKPADYPRVTPYLYYEDPETAFNWLVKAFGFTEKVRMPGPDGKLVHGELNVEDDGVVMLGRPMEGDYRRPASRHGMLYIYIDDVDAHCERARAAGAKITEEPADMFYGDRRYTAEDPEGHQWSFATRVREVSAEEMQEAMQAQA
jgi:uncharacterized glyoxalase superfamily protein PhnB